MVNFNEFKNILTESVEAENAFASVGAVYEDCVPFAINEEEMSVVDKAMAVAKIKIWTRKLEKALLAQSLEDINWENKKEKLGAKDEGTEKAKHDAKKDALKNQIEKIEGNMDTVSKGNKQLEILAADAKDGAHEKSVEKLMKAADDDDKEKYKEQLAKIKDRRADREDAIQDLGQEIHDVSKKVEKAQSQQQYKIEDIQDKIGELQEDPEGNKAAIKALEDFEKEVNRLKLDQETGEWDEEAKTLLNKSIDDVIKDKTAKSAEKPKPESKPKEGGDDKTEKEANGKKYRKVKDGDGYKYQVQDGDEWKDSDIDDEKWAAM